MSRRGSRRSSRSHFEEATYYEILKIDPNVDEDGIKKAYRRQAIKWHPDKNKEKDYAEAMFKRVAEAYEVLSDPEKRQIYDRYGKDAVSSSTSGSSGGRGGFGNFHQGFDMDRAQSLFEAFFGADPFFNNSFMFDSQGGRGVFGDPFGDDEIGGIDGFLRNQVGRANGNGGRRHRQGLGSRVSSNDPFDAFFSGGGSMSTHLGMGGGFSSSSSFSSSSGGGLSKSTRTVVQTVNGQRVSKTETTIRYPDGRVETTTDESTGQLGDSGGRHEQLQYW